MKRPEPSRGQLISEAGHRLAMEHPRLPDSFRAWFDGTCPLCQQPIIKGQNVIKHHWPKGGHSVTHTTCHLEPEKHAIEAARQRLEQRRHAKGLA